MKNLCLNLLIISVAGLSGCQAIHLKELNLSDALKNKNESILTSHKISPPTDNLLFLAKKNEQSCLHDIEVCFSDIAQLSENSKQERYAALSEIFLAKALDIANSKYCKESMHQDYLDQQLKYLDKSLRYSYVYLFAAEESPFDRIFDHRQNQVRIFYNVALSKLLTLSYEKQHYTKFPQSIEIEGHQFHLNFTQAVDIQGMNIDTFRSSYIMNFSGFHTVNRKDGLGAEFIVGRQEAYKNYGFILDPKNSSIYQKNPNIHVPKFVPVSAVAYPKNTQQLDKILNDAEFEIALLDPYQQSRIKINRQDYPLTANYSAAYGFWLSRSHLGAASYWTLLDKEENLIMPHLYMLEPFNPNKKVIVLIHGLASSPEAWVSLTNDILGDDVLRQNYQVWQIFYSTNMPIFESRFQIQALLTQAFQHYAQGTKASHDAVLIGHSMGGVISRLLVSQQDISDAAAHRMNPAQLAMLKELPVIQERFQFKAMPNFTRVVFISTPHRGTDYADRWFTRLARDMIKLPVDFSHAVQLHNHINMPIETGMVENGASSLSRSSNFIQLTQDIVPASQVVYHSIMGNIQRTSNKAKTTDGIVPYSSSHLEHAQSELIIPGGHSIQTTPEAVLELRRILHQHLLSN
ncbi:esterase/lipase family protein [Acinetobacter sp. ANC 4640]